MMESAATSVEASTAFIDRAMELLTRSDYKHFIRLIYICNYLTPNLFRKKMKFVFRNHQHLVPELNPLLPDEYQFSEQELLYEVEEDYKGLEKYQVYIKFLNNLKNKVSRTEDLRSFHDMVQSHKRKEIDAKELYGRAYNLLRGDFGLIKQLSDILRDPVPGDDSLTPSYIGLPMHVLKETSSSKDKVLNNKLRVNDTCRGGYQLTDPSHLYRRIDELIKACLDPNPPSEGALFWCEDMNCELDNLLFHLKLAEGKLNKVFKKIKRGEIIEASALRKHLSSDKVKRKLRLLERMSINLEDLISQPHDNFPVILNKVRLTKERVARARLQFHNKLYA